MFPRNGGVPVVSTPLSTTLCSQAPAPSIPLKSHGESCPSPRPPVLVGAAPPCLNPLVPARCLCPHPSWLTTKALQALGPMPFPLGGHPIHPIPVCVRMSAYFTPNHTRFSDLPKFCLCPIGKGGSWGRSDVQLLPFPGHRAS